MTKRRLFIAINLPEEARNRLIKFQEKWMDLDPKSINWVIKPNLHITLVFLGYMNDDEMYNICQMMKDVAKRHQPFFINLERIMVGPPNATPRMFWAEGAKS
ncbi:MAG: RNA 2',3'-cyclic phosphodiesterase, partial [Patescibacteria group bacterium]